MKIVSSVTLYAWLHGWGWRVGGVGSEFWNRVYMIWSSETEYKFSFETNMAENADLEER